MSVYKDKAWLAGTTCFKSQPTVKIQTWTPNYLLHKPGRGDVTPLSLLVLASPVPFPSCVDWLLAISGSNINIQRVRLRPWLSRSVLWPWCSEYGACARWAVLSCPSVFLKDMFKKRKQALWLSQWLSKFVLCLWKCSAVAQSSSPSVVLHEFKCYFC